jgi:hypothetical protein
LHFYFYKLTIAVRATPVMDIFESFESQDPLSSFRAWTNERFLRYRLWGTIGLSLISWCWSISIMGASSIIFKSKIFWYH